MGLQAHGGGADQDDAAGDSLQRDEAVEHLVGADPFERRAVRVQADEQLAPIVERDRPAVQVEALEMSPATGAQPHLGVTACLEHGLQGQVRVELPPVGDDQRQAAEHAVIVRGDVDETRSRRGPAEHLDAAHRRIGREQPAACSCFRRRGGGQGGHRLAGTPGQAVARAVEGKTVGQHERPAGQGPGQGGVVVEQVRGHTGKIHTNVVFLLEGRARHAPRGAVRFGEDDVHTHARRTGSAYPLEQPGDAVTRPGPLAEPGQAALVDVDEQGTGRGRGRRREQGGAHLGVVEAAVQKGAEIDPQQVHQGKQQGDHQPGEDDRPMCPFGSVQQGFAGGEKVHGKGSGQVLSGGGRRAGGTTG